MTLYTNGTDGKGLGCFTDRVLEPDELIDEAPVLLIEKPSDRTEMECIGEPWEHCVPWSMTHWGIALSKVSCCNYADDPNAYWFVDRRKKILVMKAMRRIEKDEEITIDYYFTSEPWFEVR